VKNRMPKSFLRIVAVLGLGLVFSGCTTSPTDVISLEDLTGQLGIQLASTTGGSGASASGMAFVAPAAELTLPGINEINVPSPGTRSVMTWPVVENFTIVPRFSGHDILLRWPAINNWPCFDILDPQHCYFGHSGIIYFSRGRGQWYALSTEWMRRGRENTGTYYPYEEKFTEGSIRNGDPIGFFVAGPWRHQSDRDAYHRRTNVTWYTWPSLTLLPWGDPAGGGGGGDGGGGGGTSSEPTIEEIHVYITGITTQLSGGTIVDFAVEVGDVDLLSLRGQPRSVVNADVPAGTYEWVDFVVDPGRSFLTIDGKRVELGIPLQNVRVNGPFVVDRDLPATVTIEFDPDGSLTQNADGTWTLSAVVVLKVGTG